MCAAVGLAVMVAWLVRATPVLRFGSQNPMAFNTGLAFVVTGVALAALARGIPRAALVAGVFDVILGALVLAEYASGPRSRHRSADREFLPQPDRTFCPGGWRSILRCA